MEATMQDKQRPTGSFILDKMKTFFSSHPEREVFFDAGLRISYFEANYILSVLITYLTDVWQLDLFKAVMITSIQGGAKAVFIIFIACLADAYLGNSKTLLLSAALYVIGLLLLYFRFPHVTEDEIINCTRNNICNKHRLGWLFYLALVLITVGQCGYSKYVERQEKENDKEKTRKEEEANIAKIQEEVGEEEQVKTDNHKICTKLKTLITKVLKGLWVAFKNWWVQVIGFIIAVFVISQSIPESSANIFLTPGLLLAGSFVLFIIGKMYFYPFDGPNKNPLAPILRVFEAAFIKRGSDICGTCKYFGDENELGDHRLNSQLQNGDDDDDDDDDDDIDIACNGTSDDEDLNFESQNDGSTSDDDNNQNSEPQNDYRIRIINGISSTVAVAAAAADGGGGGGGGDESRNFESPKIDGAGNVDDNKKLRIQIDIGDHNHHNQTNDTGDQHDQYRNQNSKSENDDERTDDCDHKSQNSVLGNNTDDHDQQNQNSKSDRTDDCDHKSQNSVPGNNTDDHDQQNQNSEPQIDLTEELKCLNRAALYKPGIDDPKMLVKKGTLCTVKQVEEAKSFTKAMGLSSTFVMYGILTAVCNTFFVEQASNMNNQVMSINVPIQVLMWTSKLTRFAVGKLSKWILTKKVYASRRRFYGALRIGLGMLLSVPCFAVAFAVEHKRLQELESDNLVSAFLIIPQLLVMGAMDGLAVDGMECFFRHEIPDSLSRTYSSFLIKAVTGTGKLLSAGLFSFLHYLTRKPGHTGWFADQINDSHLDYFYLFMTGFGFLSCITYTVVAFINSRYQQRVQSQSSTP